MAGTVAGSLIFDTKTDTSGFDKGTSDISKNTKNMEGSFKNLGIAIGAAFTVSAIKSFGETLLETTANLQAMDAQFDQVFQGGENQQALEKINEQSEELGIHTDRLTESWNKFGAQFKGAGVEAQASMTMTATATNLAADAAAFYDVSLETSSASLASFLKGNFEAGDAIGVFTNATQMSVLATERYGKAWDKLTEAEKQNLLLDKVSSVYELNGAVGQAIREQDNWSNVTTNLTAEWNRFLEAVGAPVLEGVVVIVKGLTEGLGALVEVMQENPEIVRTFVNIIISFLAALTTYLVAKNMSNMVTGLAGAFDLFGKALVTPAGKAALLAGLILLLTQVLMKLSDVWGSMSSAEKLVVILAGVAIAATAAAFAIGALQSALTLGIAVVAITAGILAINTAISSAEKRAKASGNSTNIPRLASGAVIPPNSEFMAILGDQKSGTNIEAPLTTIQDALRNVMRERGGSGNGTTTVILEVDGREFARATAPYNAGETSRRGVRLINEVT